MISDGWFFSICIEFSKPLLQKPDLFCQIADLLLHPVSSSDLLGFLHMLGHLTQLIFAFVTFLVQLEELRLYHLELVGANS